MLHVLSILARYAVILAFGFAVALLVSMLAKIPAYRFVDLVVAVEVICLVAYHFRWLLGLKGT